MVGNNALQPDVVVKNQVLQIQPVEIFRRGGSPIVITEGNTIASLAVGQRGFDVTLRAFLIKNRVFTTMSEFRWQPAAAA